MLTGRVSTRRIPLIASAVLALLMALSPTLVSIGQTLHGEPDAFAPIGPESEIVATTALAPHSQGPSLALIEPAEAQPPAAEQIAVDPREEPLAVIEIPDSAQSIVALVRFDSPTDLEFIGGAVSLSAPPARIGGPPLVRIEALDASGGIVETYNDWHPLWTEVHGEGDDGEEAHSLVVQETGLGRFIIDFAVDIETIRVTDTVDEDRPTVLIEIEVQPIIVDYCAEHPDDPGCRGDEGCGLGYWQNHLAPWGTTGYSPSQSLNSVFSNLDSDIGTTSLRHALRFRGGPGLPGAQMTLLRQAVAALLNAAHPDVNFALTAADLIMLVNDALRDSHGTMLDLATQLERLSNAGCPIDAKGNSL